MSILRTHRGFTFFEIMVVLLIIGLLLAVALPNYLGAREKARRSICESNQKMIYTAAAMFINGEADSLEAMGHKERLDALVDRGYLRGNKWCECPSSNDNDYDDYTMVFDGNFISDVECDQDPDNHVWD